jgi:hypothetical protein
MFVLEVTRMNVMKDAAKEHNMAAMPGRYRHRRFQLGIEKQKRIDRTIKSGMIIAGSIFAIGMVIMQTLTGPVLRLFNGETDERTGQIAAYTAKIKT